MTQLPGSREPESPNCSLKPLSPPAAAVPAPLQTHLGGVYDKAVRYIRDEAVDVDAQVAAKQRELMTGGHSCSFWKLPEPRARCNAL